MAQLFPVSLGPHYQEEEDKEEEGVSGERWEAGREERGRGKGGLFSVIY